MALKVNLNDFRGFDQKDITFAFDWTEVEKSADGSVFDPVSGVIVGDRVGEMEFTYFPEKLFPYYSFIKDETVINVLITLTAFGEKITKEFEFSHHIKKYNARGQGSAFLLSEPQNPSYGECIDALNKGKRVRFKLKEFYIVKNKMYHFEISNFSWQRHINSFNCTSYIISEEVTAQFTRKEFIPD